MDKLFGKDEAIFLAELEEKAKMMKLKEKTQELISYLKENYETKIKDAIKKDSLTKEVSIVVPKHYRVKGEADLIEEILNKEFGLLGFTVSYYHRFCHCLLNPLCNHNGCTVIFKW